MPGATMVGTDSDAHLKVRTCLERCRSRVVGPVCLHLAVHLDLGDDVEESDRHVAGEQEVRGDFAVGSRGQGRNDPAADHHVAGTDDGVGGQEQLHLRLDRRRTPPAFRTVSVILMVVPGMATDRNREAGDHEIRTDHDGTGHPDVVALVGLDDGTRRVGPGDDAVNPRRGRPRNGELGRPAAGARPAARGPISRLPSRTSVGSKVVFVER